MSRLPSPRPDPALAADPSLHANRGTPVRPEETDVPLLDSRQAATRPAPAPAPAATPPPAEAPAASRDPRVRLEALFDPGSLSLLSADDTSGVYAGTGSIDGMTAV